MYSIILILALISVISAFAPSNIQPAFSSQLGRTAIQRAPNNHLFLSSENEEAEDIAASSFEAETASVPKAKNLVRNVDKEQKWQDPTLAANTSASISGYAW